MSFQEKDIRSVYHSWLEKLKLIPKHQFYKNYSKDNINSKVIWQNHEKPNNYTQPTLPANLSFL